MVEHLSSIWVLTDSESKPATYNIFSRVVLRKQGVEILFMDKSAGYHALQEATEVSHHIQKTSDVVYDLLFFNIGIGLTYDDYQQVQKHQGQYDIHEVEGYETTHIKWLPASLTFWGIPVDQHDGLVDWLIEGRELAIDSLTVKYGEAVGKSPAQGNSHHHTGQDSQESHHILENAQYHGDEVPCSLEQSQHRDASHEYDRQKNETYQDQSQASALWIANQYTYDDDTSERVEEVYIVPGVFEVGTAMSLGPQAFCLEDE